MKKISMFCALAVTAINTQAQPLPNPTAWWKLEGNANDSSGNANGVASNIQWVSSTLQGVNKTVAQFDGTAVINVTEQPSIQLGSRFSLAAWVNASQWLSTKYSIFGAGGVVGSAEPSYSFTAGSSDDGFQMSGANDYPLNSQVYFYGGAFSSLPSNSWTHFALTYDGITIKSYVNGMVVTNTSAFSNANNISPYTNFGALRFGTSHGSDPSFNGLMSDLRIYGTALSDAQVLEVATVPEPSTYALLLLSGAASLWALRRRKS